MAKQEKRLFFPTTYWRHIEEGREVEKVPPGGEVTDLQYVVFEGPGTFWLLQEASARRGAQTGRPVRWPRVGPEMRPNFDDQLEAFREIA